MKITLYPKYLIRSLFVHGRHDFFKDGYKLLYPEYSRHGMTPWQHYVVDGKRKGFGNGTEPPETKFFREGYETEYPDVEASGVDPWRHFAEKGLSEGRDNGLNPDGKVFFKEGYLAMYPDVAKSGMDPWHHYVLKGKKEGRDNGLHPGSKMFFPQGYLSMYPDVAKSGMDPWHHYVLKGKKEKRDNGHHPDSKQFFAAGYLEMYPDVAKAGMDPWLHYVQYGKKNGHDNGLHPSEKVFFAKGYLEMYTDVAKSGMDPWQHYVKYGKKEGRSNLTYMVKVRSDLETYTSWILDVHENKSHFVNNDGRMYHREERDPKIFAYYLPQFHAIPLNDANFGKGFTEWTNVTRASPLFYGHVQPRVPYDVGFYNLENVDVIERQVKLAKQFGIYGFCFYYYWFSGQRVLEKPLDLFLKSKIDFKFHLMWANENWSKLWDGGNRELILEQKFDETQIDDFYRDLLPYIKDKRYEKIDNRPILAVYRVTLLGEELFQRFASRLNDLAIKDGFNGFYFLGANAFNFCEPEKYHLDGLIEFPPHGISHDLKMVTDAKWFNLKCNVKLWDLHKWINEKGYLADKKYNVFKCCFPNWDNSPRKAYSRGWVFLMKNDDFYRWLSGIIRWTKSQHSQKEQYVYINAWNEWGEGAFLEPDTRFGYSSLCAVRKALEVTRIY